MSDQPMCATESSQSPLADEDAHTHSAAIQGEEYLLWRRWRGDRDAGSRDTLLAKHLPYAKVMAALIYGQRSHADVDFDDYLQLARIGLLEAFDRYDPELNVQFRTFAARRIRGMVLDGVAQLSERQQQLSVRRRLLAERSASIAHRQGPMPTPASPSTNLGAAHDQHDGGLFQYLAEVGIGLAVGFMLEDSGMFAAPKERSSGPDPAYQAVALKHTRQQLLALLKQLPAAEQRVLSLHYLQGQAFEEIARALNLTKGRISQIHKKALASLRALMIDRGSCDLTF